MNQTIMSWEETNATTMDNRPDRELFSRSFCCVFSHMAHIDGHSSSGSPITGGSLSETSQRRNRNVWRDGFAFAHKQVHKVHFTATGYWSLLHECERLPSVSLHHHHEKLCSCLPMVVEGFLFVSTSFRSRSLFVCHHQTSGLPCSFPRRVTPGAWGVVVVVIVVFGLLHQPIIIIIIIDDSPLVSFVFFASLLRSFSSFRVHFEKDKFHNRNGTHPAIK